jgi:hypothetical protein
MMKLRYSVSQAECFRAGLNCPNSIQLIEVDPAALEQEQRNLIADRLSGINVCKLGVWGSGGEAKVIALKDSDGDPILLEARLPGFDHLVEAARQNAADVEKQLSDSKLATSDRPY